MTSRWRAGPRRLTRLVTGLAVFGAGEALVVNAALGNSPWTVFAEGISLRSPLSVGVATILVSFVLLLAWIPLGVQPGLGTILNAILVGVAMDLVLLALEPTSLPLRIAELLGGIALVGLGSGLYLGTDLGPGPRDGLMTGLHRVTGRPIALIRALIELSALAAGALLGGTVGIGTVAFALLVGPAVATGIRLTARPTQPPSAPSRSAGSATRPAARTPR